MSQQPNPDRQKYEDIVGQVERIDRLYNTRLHLCILINLALAGAWAAIVRQGASKLLDAALIMLTGFAGLMINWVLNFYMDNNKRHHSYLEGEFAKLKSSDGQGFVDPFYLTERRKLKLAPEGWSRVPFLSLLFWGFVLASGTALLAARLF